MDYSDLQFLDVGVENSRRRIAYRKDQGEAFEPSGLMWLGGFNSDMSSTKAMSLAKYAETKRLDFISFDYSGHGFSEGSFEEGTIGLWLEEAEQVFTRLTRGPQILVGSSMGGYIALLVLRHLQKNNTLEAKRISCLLLIAPAWDMTEELMWKKFSPTQKKELVEKGMILQPSEYGEPYRITQKLIEEGRNHLLERQPFNPGRPVLILHGLKDTAVPPEHVEKLRTLLDGAWVTLFEISDGEHRLSRPEDLMRLFNILDTVLVNHRLKKDP